MIKHSNVYGANRAKNQKQISENKPSLHQSNPTHKQIAASITLSTFTPPQAKGVK